MRDDFLQLVADMRAAQKRFGDSAAAAAKARKLEALVDETIRTGEIPSGHGYKQANLFGNEQIGPYEKGA